MCVKTLDEIEEHFAMIKKRQLEAAEAQKLKEKSETEGRSEHDSRLRYNEKLYLNRKHASAVFKSVTRTKRNHVPDGYGIPYE